MELLTLTEINLPNKIRKLSDPFEFELIMNCKEELEEGILLTVIYVVDVTDQSKDLILSETEINPVVKGNIKFTLEADAPNLSKIPVNNLFGLTSIIIVGMYKGQQFLRIGYIVDIYYPGIPNDKLMCEEGEGCEVNEDSEYEEDEDEDESLSDFIDNDIYEDIEDENEDTKEGETGMVEDITKEDKDVSEKIIESNKEKEVITDASECTSDSPKKLLEKAVENQSNKREDTKQDDIIKHELSVILDDEGHFELNGYKINSKDIEMNVMENPDVYSFLIKWNDGEDTKENNDGVVQEEEFSKKRRVNE